MKPNPDTPIAIGDPTASDSLYCNMCNVKLLRSGKDFVCGRCGITYNPEQENVRHGIMVETIDGVIATGQKDIDDNAYIAYPPEPEYSRRKKVEPKGGFKALAEKGTIRIVSYTESDAK